MNTKLSKRSKHKFALKEYKLAARHVKAPLKAKTVKHRRPFMNNASFWDLFRNPWLWLFAARSHS